MHKQKNTFRPRNIRAFTLVELIVVIVILAILSTIAFISFSSQSSSARDGKRLADISNIVSGIGMFQALSGKLPIPENKISITASGNVLAYQGYASKNILNMIKLSDGGADPLDDSAYTYSTDPSQSRFQIIGFLESSNNPALSLFPAFPINASADPSSYSGRYIYAKGDRMTALFASGTMIPVQSQYEASSFTGVDVLASNQELSALVGDNKVVSGTGVVLKSIIGGMGLLGYWNFDEGSGTKSSDYSGNGNNGTLTGSVLPIWTGGVLGKSLYFNNSLTQTGYFDVGPSMSLSPQYLDTNVWMKSDGTNPNLLPTTRLLRNRLYGYSIGYSGGIVTCSWTYGVSLSASASHVAEIKDDQWHNIHCSYSQNRQAIYVDGIKIVEYNKPVQPIYYVGNYFGIGKDANGSGGYYYGSIDEVRIYNRVLSDSEVSLLYKIAK